MNSGKQKTILIVEDETLIAMSEAATLEKYGYKAITVNTGEKAVRTVNETPDIDLILMDINLGKGMDGRQAAEIILGKHTLPIIFLSSHTEREVVEKTEGITSYGYIVKDSGETVLIASIKMAFRLFDAKQKEIEKEIALRKSEEQLKAFFSHIPSLVLLKDYELRIIYANEKYKSLFPFDSWKEKKPEEAFPKEVASFMISKDNEALEKGYVNYEEDWTDVKGIRHTFLTEKFKIDMPDNKPLLGAIITDITERKREQKALRETEERLSSFMDSASDSFFILDSNMNFIEINKRGAEIIGKKKEDIIGKNITDIVPDVKEYDRYEKHFELIRSGKLFVIEHFVPHPIFGNMHFVLNSFKVGDGLGVIAHDITDRKKAEEALQESEEIFRRFMEYSPIYVFFKDENIRAIRLSKNYETMLGKPLAELLGKSMDELFPSAIAKSMVADDMKTMKEGKEITVEEELNGRYYSTIKFPIFTEGKPRYLAGYSMDITERKQAEQMLRESNTNFRQLAENINEVFWLRDAETDRIIYVSPTYQKIWGRSVDSLYDTSRSFLDDVHPDDLPRARFARQALRQKGEKFDIEYRVVRPDGEVRWVRARTYPVYDENDRLIRYAGIAEDITERKLAEESVMESEERFSTIFEEAYLGIVITSPSFVFQKVNPAFCRMLGYTAEELCSMTFADITHPEHLNQDIENVKKVGRGEIPFYRTEKRYINKKGEILWGNLVVSSIRDKHGALLYYLSMIDNITERKAAEDKLVAAMHETDILRERAEKAYQEKELLLREVHHRIKNNMSTIISILSLHSNTMKDPSVVSALEDATSRLRSMGVLYDKLYRSENFRELSIKDYIPSLVEEIVGMYPKSASVKIETIIEDFVLGEKVLSPLGIIVNELITNAMKYAFTGRDDGLITVSASIKGIHATVAIEDNGNGLPESVDIESSNGLGFKLVGMLTKQIGGTMKIERRKGTKFVLEFDV